MPGGTAARSDRVVTVPNALSVLRLALVPVFLYVLLDVLEADGWAFAILVVSGFSGGSTAR